MSHFPTACNQFRSGCHDNSFHLIRFVLASAVVFSHSFPLVGCAEPDQFWFGNLLNFGRIAVDGFFLLSGFLIAQSYLNCNDAQQFLVRRVRRIYPGFAAAWLVSVFVVGPLGGSLSIRGYFAAQNWRHLLCNAAVLGSPTRIAGVFAGAPYAHVNSSLWSIRYEFLCYVLTLALGMSGLLTRRWLVVGLAATVQIAYLVQIQVGSITMGPGWLILAPVLRLASFFLAGVTFCLYREHLSRPVWVLVGAGLVSVLALRSLEVSQAVVPWLGGLALLGLGARSSRLGRWFDGWPDVSYGIYLYSWPIQKLLVAAGTSSSWGLFALSLPLSIAAGYLSWTLIEKPCLTWKLRRPTLPRIDHLIAQLGTLRKPMVTN